MPPWKSRESIQLKSLTLFFSIFIKALLASCAKQSQSRCEAMLSHFVECDYCANTLDLNKHGRGLKDLEYTGQDVELLDLKLNVNAYDSKRKMDLREQNRYVISKSLRESGGKHLYPANFSVNNAMRQWDDVGV